MTGLMWHKTVTQTNGFLSIRPLKQTSWKFETQHCSFRIKFHSKCNSRYPEPVVIQWQFSGNPVCLELRPQCTLECHWERIVGSQCVLQCASSDFPVVFQCVQIMQINNGSPLEYHWVLASASVVPVSSQCTCGSSCLPMCSNYAS